TWDDFPEEDTEESNPDDLPVSWEDADDETWSSFFLQIDSELFLGGNAIGKVFRLEDGGDDDGAPIEMVYQSASWNPFKEEGRKAQLGYLDVYVDTDANAVMTVDFFDDDQSQPYTSQTVNMLPQLGFIADIQNVALTNPCQVTAAQNGLSTGDQIYIYSVQGTLEVN